MAELNRAGELNSLGHIDTTQKTFRQQIDVVSDELRQLAGNSDIPEEALNAPYLLYVNAYTGRDNYISGDYKTTGNVEQRISLQRLECGYTEAAPFRTLSRAVLEAGIITSRDYQTTESKQNALVTIVMMTGNHIILNGLGKGDTVNDFKPWDDGKVPTDEELTSFNPKIRGGVILPRGCSVVSLDLRKTILRPDYVPAPADELPDLSNRSAMIRLTGQCYMYGFTLRDKVGVESSHHLLSGFEYANKAELDEFYGKILKTFAGLSAANAVPDEGENQIVGPQPRLPVEAVDTTGSASPYIYNISIRSEWGLCGMFADGAESTGFKSMVVAQYTGVSLQRDLNSWEKYDRGNWVTFSDYTDLINTDPDDVRAKPERRSFHVRTSNGAIIQEVSVFAIGQAIHHLAESGSQITITNSNSNFGGCAALADGFQAEAAPGDGAWDITAVRRAVNPLDKTSNIKRLFLGLLEDTQANSATTLDLQNDLAESIDDPTQPDLLVREGYTLKENDYVWVENPGGPDYRAQLAATPWDPANPDKIQIKTRVETDNASNNVNPDDPNTDDNVIVDIKGQRVYIRRLLDVRTVAERRYLIINEGGTEKLRLPVRDYVIQPTTGNDWELAIQAVAGSENNTELTNGANVELRYSKRPDGDTAFATDVYYRKADVVRRENKHWFAVRDNYGPWEDRDWQESYVHMEEEFAPEGYYTNAQPIISFNNDSDQSEDSDDLGNALTDELIVAQIRSAVDYLGLFYLLRNLGYTEGQAHNVLTPQSAENADLDVSGNGWEVEYRRPTNIRLFGHAYEWSGRGQYSTGLPQYQGDLSPNNKFTYLFTNQAGGKVYASGFNEEGFLVTPRGIEDLTSGAVLGLEDIGNPDRPISYPTVLNSLTIKDTLDLSTATIIGLQTGLLNRVGGGEIASLQEIESAPIPASDAALEEDQPTNFITPRGLKYWASWAKVVTQREGVTVYYVVPDNAVTGGTYDWNYDNNVGTVDGKLALNPNREITDNPPTTRETACTFSRAVEYANKVFSATETVQYRLANGPYYSDQSFNHVAQVVGAVNKFPSNNRLSDFQAGAKPTTDVKTLMDTMQMPVFATRSVTRVVEYSRRINAFAFPSKLNFTKGGSINGVGWQTANGTFADTVNFPNAIISSGLQPYRNSLSVPSAFDAWINTAEVPSNYTFDRYYGTQNILVDNAPMSIRNCIFGAKAPGIGNVGYGTTGPCVNVKGDCTVAMAGIYFLGNTVGLSYPLAEAKCQKVETVYGVKNSQEMIGGVDAIAKPVTLTLSFAFVVAQNCVSKRCERDFDVNCLHILDNNGNYGTMSNIGATNGTRGASMLKLIGELPPGSKLYTGGYDSYRTSTRFTAADAHHGFAGVFGRCERYANNDTPSVPVDNSGPQGIDNTRQPMTLIRNSSYHNAVWQQARTATRVTQDVTGTPSSGTNEQAYTDSSANALNINSDIWYQGIDVTTAQTVGGSLTDSKFYG